MNATSTLRGPRLTARVLASVTALLLVVGGLVTTYRVGMAVADWPTTFGHSMFAYPLGEMLQDWGVTVEHSHRMLGSVVGLLSLALVMVAAARCAPAVVALTGMAVTAEVLLVFAVLGAGTVGGALQVGLLGAVVALLVLALRWSERRGLRALAAAAHVAVIGQGLLGGTRVLEDSQHLAFLHGSAAQLVFLLVALTVVVTSKGYQAAPATTRTGRGTTSLAAFATLVVYAQIVVGAWLRHSGQEVPLMLHMALAFGAVGAVLALARRLREEVEDAGPGEDLGGLSRARSWMLACVSLQILLGGLSLIAIQVVSGGFSGPVTAFEAIAASAHVLGGALLLASCAAAALLSARLASPARAHANRESRAAAPALEGGTI